MSPNREEAEVDISVSYVLISSGVIIYRISLTEQLSRPIKYAAGCGAGGRTHADGG